MGLSSALSAAFEKFKERNTDKSEFTELKEIITSGGPDLPAPIALKLLPIADAFSDSYFNLLDQQFKCNRLRQRKTNLHRLLTDYPALMQAMRPTGMINGHKKGNVIQTTSIIMKFITQLE